MVLSIDEATVDGTPGSTVDPDPAEPPSVIPTRGDAAVFEDERTPTHDHLGRVEDPWS